MMQGRCAYFLLALATVASTLAAPPYPAKSLHAHQVSVSIKDDSKTGRQQAVGPQKVPAECVEGVENMKKAEGIKAAQHCEEEGRFPQKAIMSLQKGDEKGALGHVEDLFATCAKLTKQCAALVAPQLVIQLRFSGAAVSENCGKEMESVQTDGKQMKKAAWCDKKQGISEKALVALKDGDLEAAISSTQEGLQDCMGMSKTCSFQLAPPVLNSVIMRTMMEQAMVEEEQEQTPLTTVFVGRPIIVVEEPMVNVKAEPSGTLRSKASSKTKTVSSKKKHGPVSLVAMASGQEPRSPQRRRMVRGTHAPALIQEPPLRSPWVSRLITELALKQPI